MWHRCPEYYRGLVYELVLPHDDEASEYCLFCSPCLTYPVLDNARSSHK